MEYQMKTGHTVYLDAYWIDKTEVTNCHVCLCVEAPGSVRRQAIPVLYNRLSYYGTCSSKLPVVYVRWDGKTTVAGLLGFTNRADGKKPRVGWMATYPWGNNDPTCNLENYNQCVAIPIRWIYLDGASPLALLIWLGTYMSGWRIGTVLLLQSIGGNQPPGPSAAVFQ